MPQPVSISARIEALEAAERRISLSEEPKLSSKPMAEALSVTWPTLRSWCDLPAFDEAGAFVRGGNGIEWEFNPAKTVSTLLAHFRGEMARRQDRNRRVVESVGLDMDPTEAEHIDIVDLKKQVDLTIAIQQQKLAMGGYIPAAKFIEVMRGYNQAAIGAVLGTDTLIDPTGALPPDIRAAMNEALRSVAATMNQRCADYIRSAGAGSSEAGDRRAV